jgi:hypothetical protein
LGKDYLSKQFHSSSSHHQILYNPTLSSAENSQNFNYPPPIQPKGKKFFLIPKLVTPKSSVQSLKNRKLNLVLMEPYRVSILIEKLLLGNKRKVFSFFEKTNRRIFTIFHDFSFEFFEYFCLKS